jgi:hypothetical protein
MLVSTSTTSLGAIRQRRFRRGQGDEAGETLQDRIDNTVEEHFDDIDTWFPPTESKAVEGEAVGVAEQVDRPEPEPEPETSAGRGDSALEEGARPRGERPATATEASATELTAQGDQQIVRAAFGTLLGGNVGRLQILREILLTYEAIVTTLSPGDFNAVQGRIRSLAFFVQIGLNAIKDSKYAQTVLAHDAVYPLSGLA